MGKISEKDYRKLFNAGLMAGFKSHNVEVNVKLMQERIDIAVKDAKQRGWIKQTKLEKTIEFHKKIVLKYADADNVPIVFYECINMFREVIKESQEKNE